MKKLIWIILLLIPICHVSAEEWVSSEEIPDMELTTLETKEEKEYLWYKLKKEGGYYQEKPSEEYAKTDFFSFTPWTEWGKEKLEMDYFQTRTVYYYKELKKVKYIRISDLKNENMKLSNIRAYHGKDNIEHTLYEEDGIFIIELMEPCYYDELELEMNLLNTVEQYNGFWIEWLYELDQSPCMSVYSLTSFKTVGNIRYSYRNLNENKLVYEEEQVSLEKVENNSHRLVRTEEEYRYQTRLDYYEKEVREYYQEYSSTPVEDYIYPDFETEKIKLFYRIKEGKKEEPKIEVVETIKEVHDVVEVPLKETVVVEKPAIIKNESSAEFIRIKKELEEANATIASLKNEQSREIETKPITIKKQSFPFILFVPCLLVGYLVGRIVTTKKKL